MSTGAALLGLVGCQAPGVQARAAWVSAAVGETDARTLWLYDRGDIETIRLAPVGEGPIRAQMAADGRGLLIRGSDLDSTYSQLAAYLDLHDGRRLSFLTPPPGPSADPARVLGRGAGVMWREEQGIALVPTAPGVELGSTAEGFVTPILAPELDLQGVERWDVQTAAAAPIAYGIIGDGDFLSFGLVAFSVPGGREDGGEPGLEILASFTNDVEAEGTLVVQAKPFDGRDSECAQASSCFTRGAIFPDGSGMVYRPLIATCPLLRFEHAGPELSCTTLPEDLQSASLLAALDDRHLVFVDNQRLLLWRIGEGVEPFAVLGSGPYSFHHVDRGRKVLFLSNTGQAVAVTKEGFSILTTQSTVCETLARKPAVSPNGEHAAWACKPLAMGTAPAIEDVERSDLVRIGRDGLERLSGVPVSVLSIDNDGDVLFHSEGQALGTDEEDADGIEPTSPPRNLLVLSAEGTVYRIDQLEPTPSGIKNFEGEGVFLMSAPIED